MNWKDTPEQAAFRAEVRQFIRARFPTGYRPDTDTQQSLEPEDVYGYNWAADRRSAEPERRDGAMAWARALGERGWVAPHFPKEYGGAALGAIEDCILQEEMMRARVPAVSGIGVGLLGPTLLTYGAEAQKREHLPHIARGEVAWAQGFSEPGSGSDLASLKTRAVRDGEDYVVNGQKVWTSLAQYSEWAMVLVRTDPRADRPHRGISYLMVDLASPGITVRPIEDLRGGTPFCEMFFEDVRVPAANRVGEENQGWRVAMATLGFERSGLGSVIRYQHALDRLVALMKSDESRRFLRTDARGALRQEIAQRQIEIRVLYNLALHSVSRRASGGVPGHEASISQLFGAELHQRLARTGMKAFGSWAHLTQSRDAPLEAMFTHDFLGAIAHPFLGGSSEVQRNVIATRGLGLPRN
ncbi:MAG: acyl-CoA dehydrogenase family protein [Gammaproteobacteria bacterium]|nr:acyl-CoA dehydrogenase family protein [Gammaproteobacteria bacterium]MDH3411506.1 acyl-CoA dehydrogenase family protein [Gammaproteobacteria bacterium]